MVKVSVIIPVYQVEAYLEECVRSVMRQSMKEIEIILVDDGSPDRCGEICDRLAQQDGRIKVIHKSNGGISDTRNAGLKIAVGEYIGFVDSDDVVSEFMFEILYQSAKEHEADISECGVTREQNTLFHGPEPKPISVAFYDSNIMSAYLKTHKVGVWCRIYLRALLGGFSFETGLKHEDVIASYQLFSKCRRYVRCENELYYYRVGSGLSKANITSFDLQSVRVAKRCEKEFPEASPDALVLTYFDMSNYMKRAVICGFASIELQAEYPSVRKSWSRYLRKHMRDIISAEVYTSKEKFQLVLAGAFYPIFYIMCRWIISSKWQKQAMN